MVQSGTVQTAVEQEFPASQFQTPADRQHGTYTVMKRLEERGVLKVENKIVTSLFSKDQIQQAELDEFMTKTFEGSLPAFIAAFGKRQALSDKDIEEIQRIIQG